jgi:protein-L-isoaspartate(D-aspartate) O-methyltransferase
MENDDFRVDLKRMIDEQIIKRGIQDKRVIQAMQVVPRHLFVPTDYVQFSYHDGPLPIGFEQTISQPYIVALMISHLNLIGSEHILEIGTGCGYQTAIMAHLAMDVVSMEIIPELTERASRNISALGFKNIKLVTGDGSQGLVADAPYNGILLSAAAPQVPPPLLEQLADGGRLVLPVGSRGFQQLEIWYRNGSEFRSEISIPVSFVPLRGKHGWQS